MTTRIGAIAMGTAIIAVLATGSRTLAQPSVHTAWSRLLGVRLRASGDTIQIVLEMSAPVRYKSSRSQNPPRVTIDILNADISPLLTKREFAGQGFTLRKVLITRSERGIRASLDLDGAGPYSVYFAPKTNHLIISVKSRGEQGQAHQPEPPARLPASSLPGVQIVQPIHPPATADVSFTPPADWVSIPWVPRRPQIDDFVLGSQRAEARVTGFRQREPGDGNPVSETTTAYLSYDSEFLYVVFVCASDQEMVRTHVGPREDLAGDDQVAVYLDTFHDGRHAYVFASNPSGVQQDGVLDDSDKPDYTPDMLWDAEARRTDGGFIVLMAIPFKSLRFSGDWVQTWRIALARTIAWRGETAFWPYITQRISGFVRQMGALEGLELISPGHNIQVTPYGTFTQSRIFDPPSPDVTNARTRRGGLDAKVVLRNAATIDAAINPDFSEVQSNDPQVLINQRFEVFIPEKRPLFMEDARLFELPINMFYSRRIADPEFGTRFTMRSSGWAVGAMGTNDRGVQPAQSARLFGDHALIGALRVQRQFGDDMKLGVLATDRQIGQSWNRVLSLDEAVQLGSTWSISSQAVRTEDHDDRGAHLVGSAYFAGVDKVDRHFSYTGTYRDVGDTVRAPLGFVPRVGIRGTAHTTSYTWRTGEADKWAFGPSVATSVDWDQQGTRQDDWTSADFDLAVAGQTEIRASRSEGFERLGATELRKQTKAVSFWNGTIPWLSAWASYSWGTGPNYSPPANTPPYLGNEQGLYAWLALRPAAFLRFEQILFTNNMRTIAGTPPGGTRVHDIFSSRIVRWKTNVQFTRALGVRTIVDFNDLRSDPRFFATPGSKHLTGDALVTYVLNPGTAVYGGITNQYQNIPIGRPGVPTPRQTDLPTFPVAQQIFVKVSYLFRF